MAPLPKVRFIPECHADTALVRYLTDGFPNIDHEAGISSVAKNFENVRDKTYKLIGIVDNDKQTPKYLDDFKLVKKSNGVILLKKKPDKEHYLIIISPALEKFLIENCSAIGKTMGDFKLSDDMHRLKVITKNPRIGRNSNFHNLIQGLLKRNAPGIATFKEYLVEFL